MPAFGKVFESLVTSFVSSQLSSVISINQHGFTKGRSSSNILIEFVHFSLGKIEKGGFDVIYTDIKKAFDTLNHRILLKKTVSNWYSLVTTIMD